MHLSSAHIDYVLIMILYLGNYVLWNFKGNGELRFMHEMW